MPCVRRKTGRRAGCMPAAICRPWNTSTNRVTSAATESSPQPHGGAGTGKEVIEDFPRADSMPEGSVERLFVSADSAGLAHRPAPIGVLACDRRIWSAEEDKCLALRASIG